MSSISVATSRLNLIETLQVRARRPFVTPSVRLAAAKLAAQRLESELSGGEWENEGGASLAVTPVMAVSAVADGQARSEASERIRIGLLRRQHFPISSENTGPRSTQLLPLIGPLAAESWL